jgi:hypothetical protein
MWTCCIRRSQYNLSSDFLDLSVSGLDSTNKQHCALTQVRWWCACNRNVGQWKGPYVVTVRSWTYSVYCICFLGLFFSSCWTACWSLRKPKCSKRQFNCSITNYSPLTKRKANWIGHILRRNCLLKQVIEGKIQGEMEVTRRWGRRRKKLLDDLKDRRGW